MQEGRPFQYSLRIIFAVTTLLAIACSLLLASPGWVRMLTAVGFVYALPAILIVLVIHGRGYLRTFVIGALSAAGMPCLVVGTYSLYTFIALAVEGWSMLGDLDVGYYPAIGIAILCMVSFAVGLLAMGTRWLVEAPRRQELAPSLPAIDAQLPADAIP